MRNILVVGFRNFVTFEVENRRRFFVDLWKRNFGNDLLGDEVSLILLAAPNAMEYYLKVGFAKADNAFIIPRKHHV